MLNNKILIIFMLILLFPLVSAQLKIEKEVVTDTIISELNQPAIFNIKITNLGAEDEIRIYSLVGVDITPSDYFKIGAAETKTIEIKLSPNSAILQNSGTFSFVYKIEGKSLGIVEDTLLIKIVDLKNAIEINSYNINLEDNKAVVYVKNKGNSEFSNINAVFTSSFFNFSEQFSLGKYEKKEFEINLDREKIKSLTAGQYILKTELNVNNIKETIEDSFTFTEKAEITERETKKGFVIYTHTKEKINEGNLPFLVQINLNKNIISRLFTTFNIVPLKTERDGITIKYTFQQEVYPGEIFAVKAVTNWLYPLILIAAIVIIVLLLRKITSSHIIIKKKSSFVKTKGGEFALKISLIVKAKSFAENIKIIDKVPSLVRIYKKFGAIEPDNIDERNKRLEWNIENLQEGEERLFSYVIYSKISPIGKFEIPPARGIYDKDGKSYETESNKVFFFTEPKKESDEE